MRSNKKLWRTLLLLGKKAQHCHFISQKTANPGMKQPESWYWMQCCCFWTIANLITKDEQKKALSNQGNSTVYCSPYLPNYHILKVLHYSFKSFLRNLYMNCFCPSLLEIYASPHHNFKCTKLKERFTKFWSGLIVLTVSQDPFKRSVYIHVLERRIGCTENAVKTTDWLSTQTCESPYEWDNLKSKQAFK